MDWKVSGSTDKDECQILRDYAIDPFPRAGLPRFPEGFCCEMPVVVKIESVPRGLILSVK